MVLALIGVMRSLPILSRWQILSEQGLLEVGQLFDLPMIIIEYAVICNFFEIILAQQS